MSILHRLLRGVDDENLNLPETCSTLRELASNFLSVELHYPICRLPLGIGYRQFNQTHIKRAEAITCLGACLTHQLPGESTGRLIQQVD